MIHAYPDGTPIRVGDRVVWLRPTAPFGEQVAVAAVVMKCVGHMVALHVYVAGRLAQRHARPEHLRRAS